MIHFPGRTPGCIGYLGGKEASAATCCWLCLLRLHWEAAKAEYEEQKREEREG